MAQYLCVLRNGRKMTADVFPEMNDAIGVASRMAMRPEKTQVITNPDAFDNKALMAGLPTTVLELHGKGLLGQKKDAFVIRVPKVSRRSFFFTLQADGSMALTRMGKPMPSTVPSRFPLVFDLRHLGVDKTIKVFASSLGWKLRDYAQAMPLPAENSVLTVADIKALPVAQ